jgi:putative transposase
MNFRRYYLPNQIVFITQVVFKRQPLFSSEQNIILLRETLHAVQKLHPYKMLAYAFLPDHFHLLIHPTGAANFSQIMHSLKRNFTINYKKVMRISSPYHLWQNRFWDHVIRDEIDLENHIHYIHVNPMKHGYVNDPFQWKNSSINSWQEKGLYPEGFAWEEPKGSDWGE